MKQIFLLSISILISIGLYGQNSIDTIIDSHCHIKTRGDETIKTLDAYFKENQSFNIKYVFGLTIARQRETQNTISQNDSLILMSKKNHKLISVCSVHPYDGDAAIKELDRLSILGVRFIKLHPVTQNFQILDERVLNVAKFAGEHNMVILIDSYGLIQENNVEKLLMLALMNPKTKFIFAHMGGSDFFKFSGFKVVKKQTQLFNNVWFDISATVGIYADSPYKEQLLWVMRQVGIDRILFGSDDPAFPLTEALNAFYKFDLNDEERKLILYKNALKLIKTN